jgi:hypothetical protein
MRNFVKAVTIVTAMSLTGCGEKEEDTAEETEAVEEVVEDTSEVEDTGEVEDTATEESE